MYIMTLFHAKISQSIEFGTSWIPEDFFQEKNNNNNEQKKTFFGHFSWDFAPYLISCEANIEQ